MHRPTEDSTGTIRHTFLPISDLSEAWQGTRIRLYPWLVIFGLFCQSLEMGYLCRACTVDINPPYSTQDSYVPSLTGLQSDLKIHPGFPFVFVIRYIFVWFASDTVNVFLFPGNSLNQ